ncbi:hypothetical protein SLS58_005850 [Diplodia intermedia]|uniref:Uncharacterized protein n=1 Tax=Diplodia intermedia TaxID=856260 RepID=A0ABR3TPU4_9PEZI
MYFCLPFERHRPQPKLKSDDEPVLPIYVYLRGNSAKTRSRLAVLWTPEDNPKTNIVSAKLVTDHFGLEIQRSEKDPTSVQFRGEDLKIKGHVMLQWGTGRSRQPHKTRFLVAAAENPPFEVVMSRNLAVEYGLVDL